MKRDIILVLLVVTVFLANQLQAGEKVGVFASTAIATSQVAPDGSRIVDSLVAQPYLEMSYGRFVIFNWNNYDIDQRRFNEHDFGIWAELFKKGDFSSYADFQYWGYPGSEEEYETAASAGVKYSNSNWVNANLKVTRQSGHSLFEPGYRLWMEISKEFSFGKFSLKPKIQGAYLWDFFNVSGVAHLTEGISGGYQFAENLNLSGFVNHQTGFEMDDFWYGGINLSYLF